MSTLTSTRIPTGTYTLDTAHSTIGFVARHAMVTKVRGSFSEFEGGAVVAEDPTQSTAHVTIKVDSIDTRNDQRDAHLRGNDFFDMENYPEIRFASTKVEPIGDDVLRVTGDLTIKATTKPVTIDFTYTGAATDPFGNERIGFEGSVTVNRKEWGVNWNAALEAGGVLVSEKVALEFDLSAIKAS